MHNTQNMVNKGICPTCGNPWFALPPIGTPKTIILPQNPPELAKKTAVHIGKALFGPVLEKDSAPKPPALKHAPEGDKPAQGNNTPAQQKAAMSKAMRPSDDIFDNPVIGGRVTVCVLMYGDYHDMHRNCVNSILSTIPYSRRQIRIACNEVCLATKKYLSRLKDEGQIFKVMDNQSNIKKYPAMRRLFYDNEQPITDKWLIWFDDDTICDRDPEWCTKLMQTIVHTHKDDCKMYGAEFYWTLKQSQVDWIRSRPWYRNRPFQVSGGREAPNGNKVKFAAGGFWALETSAMQEAGIPDESLGHNGGDVMIGEQLWQTGYSVRGWNNGKKFVHTSSVKRRGISEQHVGTVGWVPGGNAK